MKLSHGHPLGLGKGGWRRSGVFEGDEAALDAADGAQVCLLLVGEEQDRVFQVGVGRVEV